MRTNRSSEIEAFLAVGQFAVVGVSTDRAKYGNKVLRCYLQHDLPVVGVHPRLAEVEGVRCVPRLTDVAGVPPAVSVVAPPAAAAGIVRDAIEKGVAHLWFQPGAEEAHAVATARAAGLSVIEGGPCLLVVLGYRET